MDLNEYKNITVKEFIKKIQENETNLTDLLFSCRVCLVDDRLRKGVSINLDKVLFDFRPIIVEDSEEQFLELEMHLSSNDEENDEKQNLMCWFQIENKK